jgi:hypothetical protein
MHTYKDIMTIPENAIHASPYMVLMACPYMYAQTQHEARMQQLNQRALLAMPPAGTNKKKKV